MSAVTTPWAAIWRQWSLVEPCSVELLAGGTNNLVWRVTDAHGQQFVLRCLPHAALPRLRTETMLLRAIQQRGVPFHLPIPLPTRNGADVFEQTDAGYTLTPLFSGGDPACDSLMDAASAGDALGQLDVALAHLTLPEDAVLAPRYGELAAWHPLVADPIIALEQLPIALDQYRQLQRFIADVLLSIPSLYGQLPQGLVHRDYSAGNFLMAQGRVTSILDFEYLGWDVRAFDLAVALSWWNVSAMISGTVWPLLASFSSAYLARFPLTPEELSALPQLFRLRDAISLVHRMGRYLAGQETNERIIARVVHSVWREGWIAAHGEQLRREALRWFSET